MKRFRLSTLMLLVVIAALAIALVMQDWRAARREAELRRRLQYALEINDGKTLMFKVRVKEMQDKLDKLDRPSDKEGRSSDGK